MLQRPATILSEFLVSMARLYTIPHLLGFGAVFAMVLIISAKERYRPGRFRRRAFRTDLVYAVWYPIYTVLIGIPLMLRLAAVVSDRAPFLRLSLLKGLPLWLNIALWLTVSDLIQYWLHRSMHHSRWLWALHKVHHSQRELNPLSLWRVHWVESTYLNVGIFFTGLLLGDIRTIPPIVIVILAAFQFSRHSDLDWGLGPIGKLIVSPRFHARHHSLAQEDINANFGGLLVVWDRLFGTARDVAGRASAYGLVPADNDVSESFLGQQFYPLSKLAPRALRILRRLMRSESKIGIHALD